MSDKSDTANGDPMNGDMAHDARASTARATGVPPAAVPFIDAKRRGFLQGAVLAGGAAASGVSLAGDEGDSPVAVEVVKPATSGYRETDHVRDYYAAARF